MSRNRKLPGPIAIHRIFRQVVGVNLFGRRHVVLGSNDNEAIRLGNGNDHVRLTVGSAADFLAPAEQGDDSMLSNKSVHRRRLVLAGDTGRPLCLPADLDRGDGDLFP